ncbi:hypothetical protein BSKO_00107 [Bryopsis sp. KO-2023]|nr:hypothetical protein BSKO_00107 [Bryopsis sp. KO-2023]
MEQPNDFYLRKISLGTTIMAAEFDGGVVLGADTRTSGGNFIVNRATDKLTPLTESIYVARSGGAADTQAAASQLQVMLGFHEAELNKSASVHTAAYVLQQEVYKNKDHYQAGMIVAGWEKEKGGQVYSIPLGGSFVKAPFVIGGSGSMYIYGWCDKYWKPNMTKEECEKFVVSAVGHAIARDGASGGGIRTVTIDASGAKKAVVSGENLPLRYGELPTPVVAR